MRHQIDAAVDSLCYAPDVDDPDARCGSEATTYVLYRGVRRYLCPTHARDVERYDDSDDDSDQDEHPRADVCDRCRRMTPHEYINIDGVCPDCET
jgi:hypothetical protein